MKPGGRGHTNGVVFQHAHGPCSTDAVEGVEVARHGHGQEADGDDTGFGCTVGVRTLA